MGTLNRSAGMMISLMMTQAIMAVKSKFGLGMDNVRAEKLTRHISPAQYRSRGKSSRRPHKQNRLELARKAKINRRTGRG